jgi:hypothetical protein
VPVLEAMKARAAAVNTAMVAILRNMGVSSRWLVNPFQRRDAPALEISHLRTSFFS